MEQQHDWEQQSETVVDILELVAEDSGPLCCRRSGLGIWNWYWLHRIGYAQGNEPGVRPSRGFEKGKHDLKLVSIHGTRCNGAKTDREEVTRRLLSFKSYWVRMPSAQTRMISSYMATRSGRRSTQTNFLWQWRTPRAQRRCRESPACAIVTGSP